MPVEVVIGEVVEATPPAFPFDAIRAMANPDNPAPRPIRTFRLVSDCAVRMPAGVPDGND